MEVKIDDQSDFSLTANHNACETVLSSSVIPSVELGFPKPNGNPDPPTFTPPTCLKKSLPNGNRLSVFKSPSTYHNDKISPKPDHHCMGPCRCGHNNISNNTVVPTGHNLNPNEHQLCLKKLNLAQSRKIDHSTNLPLCLSSSEYLSNCYRIPPAERIEFRTNTLVDYVVTQLRKFGWCWVDSFLGPIHADKVLDEVDSLYGRHQFVDGQLAKPAGPFAQLVRTDKIRWYDQKVDGQSGSPINVLLSMIDYVVMAASPLLSNRICGRSKGMISCFPGNGAHYITHVDNPDKDGKLITVVYYINKDWIAAAGGNLRLYPQNATNYVDVYPIFDRICFFWSDRRNPHEVLPVFQKRFAITVWYFDAQEKAAAVSRELHKQNCEMSKKLNTPNVQPCGSHAMRHGPQFDVQPIKPLSMVTFKDLCDSGKPQSNFLTRSTAGSSHSLTDFDMTDESSMRTHSSQSDKGSNNERPSVIQLRKELNSSQIPDECIQVD